MRVKLRRRVRELVVMVLIAGAAILTMDALRQPDLPPDFYATSLRTVDGERVDLLAMSEQRPLLIYLWATWCGVCRYTTPSVAALADEGGNVMTIALRSGDDRALKQWLGHRYASLPVVNDRQGALSRRWQVNVTPTLVILSRGEVKSVTTGWTSRWGMRFRLWWAAQ